MLIYCVDVIQYRLMILFFIQKEPTLSLSYGCVIVQSTEYGVQAAESLSRQPN